MSHRLGQHVSSKKCVKLYNALKKYGKEKFTMECLAVSHTQEVADYWEKYFIGRYDSIETGYNLRDGGSRGKHSQETKEKISIANTGKIRTKETKLKNSIARIGKLGPNKGIRVPSNVGTNGIVIPWNKGKKQTPLLSLEQELLIARDERSSRVLSKEYGVSRSHILNIRKRHEEK
jgi:hypothetical protein